MIRIIRWLLLPVTGIYAFGVWLRNRLYDQNLLKSTSFKLPVVVIGNLAVGGTGKSPMVEYIVRLIGKQSNIAVLSRGYRRKTKGFRFVNTTDNATMVGDEPLQIKRKFSETTVAVCEDRVKAIDLLKDTHNAVLLDDAFQHRALTPSFVILLLDYQSLLKPMLPLPTGNFRDNLTESSRSNMIVITKCPDQVDADIKFAIDARLQRYSTSPTFYTKIAYNRLVNKEGSLYKDSLSEADVILLTGIAKPKPMLDYLTPKVKSIKHLSYGDHHSFTSADMDHIKQTFQKLESAQKIVVTTEKDFQRLPESFLSSLPIYILPIQQEFLYGQKALFDTMVKKAFQIG